MPLHLIHRIRMIALLTTIFGQGGVWVVWPPACSAEVAKGMEGTEGVETGLKTFTPQRHLFRISPPAHPHHLPETLDILNGEQQQDTEPQNDDESWF